MPTILLFLIVALLIVVIVLQFLLVRRKAAVDLAPVTMSFERTERIVRDEIARSREEAQSAARDGRAELADTLKGVADSLAKQIDALTRTNDQKLERMREIVEQRLQLIQEDSQKKLEQVRQDSLASAQKAREEVAAALRGFGESSTMMLTEMGSNQRTQLGNVVEQLTRLSETTDRKLDTQRTAIDARLQQIQTEARTNAATMREEITAALRGFNDSMVKAMTGVADSQKAQLDKLTESNQQKLDALKTAVEQKLQALQEDNARQLELVRATVDEKLQGTLEKRLGESFKQVSERLEQVYKGLGEMQALAAGVGDLKKVLTNVKTRGTWGEVQLGAMLGEILTPDQYGTNVSTKGDGERVEFAIKLPGRTEDTDEVVWLPIDAKFPVEDYQRLVAAQETADIEAANIAARNLEAGIKKCAKDIKEKYLCPPRTTDFGILFLPTEGLFAEVIRRPGLPECIQREFRVVIAGPTTLWSILNSLQMGFRTLTIQKRSSEVWNLLAAVKTEWTKYGDVLKKVKKKLEEASNTVDAAAQRTRVIGRKLRDVEQLSTVDSRALLKLEGPGIDGEMEEEQTTA